MRRAYSIHPPALVPLSDAMTGTDTAARMRRICSRYVSGPSANVDARGKYVIASALLSACSSITRASARPSCVICSSKSECMTIADAPASSRRRTVPRSSTSGDAEGISGCARRRPR
jgi:hypothetical protein